MSCFSLGLLFLFFSKPLQWRHNGCDCVSNHQPQDRLLNRLFRRRLKKISKLRVTGLCAGNSPVTGEFPAQMACNAKSVSIWWRHHVRVISTFIQPSAPFIVMITTDEMITYQSIIVFYINWYCISIIMSVVAIRMTWAHLYHLKEYKYLFSIKCTKQVNVFVFAVDYDFTPERHDATYILSGSTAENQRYVRTQHMLTF